LRRILLLDPDSRRSSALAFLLRHMGFIVDTDADGLGEPAGFRRTMPDLVVVAEYCPTLRDRMAARLAFQLFDKVPKMVLGEEPEEVAGIPYLEVGADAYVPSPLNVREVLARVNSLLARGAPVPVSIRMADHEGPWPDGSDYELHAEKLSLGRVGVRARSFGYSWPESQFDTRMPLTADAIAVGRSGGEEDCSSTEPMVQGNPPRTSFG